jgi:hypothetical protein
MIQILVILNICHHRFPQVHVIFTIDFQNLGKFFETPESVFPISLGDLDMDVTILLIIPHRYKNV